VLWVLGKFRVLPDDAKTWSNGRGGLDYQAQSSGGETTVGVVEPIPSDNPGTAFNLSMTVDPSQVTWAWSVLNTWHWIGNGASTATLSGQTNQYGTPVFPVTVTGPNGSINTWAELDTGNEVTTLVTPSVARAIGLLQTGSSQACGVNNCSSEPTYQGLSIAPKGTVNWMQQNVNAEGWDGAGSVSIDIGTGFLKYASVSLEGIHWVITWPVQ
jgi:hypothetical protein